jgi:hypothetical protein
MSSILADHKRPRKGAQMRGEGGWGLRVAGCGFSDNEYYCAHGAQINIGALTPYLTYDRMQPI